MKAGDLVSMSNHCGGLPGEIRCESALVVNVELSHSEQVQIGSHTYMDRVLLQHHAGGPFKAKSKHGRTRSCKDRRASFFEVADPERCKNRTGIHEHLRVNRLVWT